MIFLGKNTYINSCKLRDNNQITSLPPCQTIMYIISYKFCDLELKLRPSCYVDPGNEVEKSQIIHPMFRMFQKLAYKGWRLKN